ncbi:ABC transporter ATP-binding protein [Thermodesulfobacteriota bacterium]
MLLQVKDLNTYYGKSHVLQDMSISVDRGEIVVLLGRNGMGKSTTLKSIMGLVRPASGSIVYGEKDIFGCAPYQAARAGIGYVPEERRIFPNLPVLDNLKMGVKHGKAARMEGGNQWDLERVYTHFPILKERGSQKGSTLSGGEQQMLAIARTLMGNPDLLMVDEPTEGLSPVLTWEVRDVLESIGKTGVSILLVEHNLKVAMSLANRVYLMDKARVGFSGTVEELDASPDIRAKYLEV